ncbi:MAG TPA: sulfite exporter TauE/SafE family protein [Steroidobacteraceae bacterium]|jgi:hypothetical protein
MHASGYPALVVTAIFVLAGAVKGVAGMGLPTVAMGLLGLIMPPARAAALIVIPSLVTNLWQLGGSRSLLPLMRCLGSMLLLICASTWASAGLMTAPDAGGTTVALGAALVAYAGIALTNVRISVTGKHQLWLSPVIGAATGIVTGATGVLVIPAVPYLEALGLEKDQLVQALALSFTVSTLALTAGLAVRGAFQLAAAGSSALLVLPALLGMGAGQALRARLSPAVFRRLFLVALLALGADLVMRVWV